MRPINLDTDILRTLVTAQQLGGFNRAADKLGRSQSAISQQVRKIEQQIGATLFRKQGRGLVLTEAGDVVLAYARRLLALNDEAVEAVRGRAVEGSVRFGLPADFAESWLPCALGSFKRAHPGVRIEAVVDRNKRLLERIDRGELDLVLALANEDRGDAQRLARLPLVWVGATSCDIEWTSKRPLPLAMFEPPCFFRETALSALERAGIAWNMAFTSPSLHGLWAALEAGLGITLRTVVGLPRGVRVLGPRHGLPKDTGPAIAVCLHDGGRPLQPALDRLRSIIVQTLAANLPSRTARVANV
jgi:DNA-binding transcriptional LysR family regulator